MNNPKVIASHISYGVATSGLSPEDRLKAMDVAIKRLDALASDDPVDVLAADLVASAQREAPANQVDARVFLAAVRKEIGQIAIAQSNAIAEDAQALEAACASLNAGKVCDLSALRLDPRASAKALIACTTHEMVGPEVRTIMIRTLLDSLTASDRSSPMGSDEMFIGVVQDLGPSVRADGAMSDEADKRLSAVMRGLFSSSRSEKIENGERATEVASSRGYERNPRAMGLD